VAGEIELAITIIISGGIAGGAGAAAARAYVNTRLGKVEEAATESRDMSAILLRRECEADEELRRDIARYKPKLYDKYIKPYLNGAAAPRTGRR